LSAFSIHQWRESSDAHDYYTLKISDGKILIDEHGKSASVDFEMTVSLEYIQTVVDEKEKYIENPLKLDWAWLRDRAKSSH